MEGDIILDAHTARDAHWRLRKEGLPLWVVTEGVSDYPGKVCARAWVLDKPSNAVLLADDLTTLREMLPPDLIPFHRDPSDPPTVVETWL
jgi:hypothetical protein